jgi:hypothetical protein
VQERTTIWQSKTLHRRHACVTETPDVDTAALNTRLKVDELFPETTGFMIAIQDQVISNMYYKQHILKDHY